MLNMLLRKMLNNRWMVLSLLLGSILVVAMVSSIPLYTKGVLQRMLTRDLESLQERSGYFPGRFLVKADISARYENQDKNAFYETLDSALTQKRMEAMVGLPVTVRAKQLMRDFFVAIPWQQREQKPKKRFVRLDTLSELYDHARIVRGRLPSRAMADGTLEVMVTEQAMKELDLYLDEVYRVTDFTEQIDTPLRVQIVGVFAVKDARDPYWFQGLWAYRESFVMHWELFRSLFIEPGVQLQTKVAWYFAFDYHRITLEKVPRIINSYYSLRKWLKSYWVHDLHVPAIPILEQYRDREKQLRVTLWVLQLPILLMLGFYVFMVSQLIVEHERNEIALLKSRGSSSLQVFLSYLLESLLLGVAAMLVGPPLGLLLCAILGASNGFLEFVRRTRLPLAMTFNAYAYSLAAVCFFMITMLIPASLSSRTTIVLYKQEKSRARKAPFWRRFFLDVILLAVAGYGMYQYHSRARALAVSGVGGLELGIDPLLYLISTLFALGAGLLFLRLFPYLIRVVFTLGRKLWPPVVYATLIRVGRSSGRDQFLMLFLILTLSVGVFNASAARTLNVNVEQKIRYAVGTDIAIKSHWDSNKPPDFDMAMPDGDANAGPFDAEPLVYLEPPFAPYTRLEGVEMATKVFRRDNVIAQTPMGNWIRGVYLMGIIPHEFGRVAWFRADLLPYHWFQYLNLLARNPKAALVSRSFEERYNLELGDSLWLSWENQGFLEVVVFAFVDLWPTYNPNRKGDGNAPAGLVVANLAYIHAKMALEPYEVWLKKQDGVTSETIYRDLEKQQLPVRSLEDSMLGVVAKKNDPMLQGTNGALTLGFVVCLAISVIGFLIYWVISIRERTLQFGVLRAIGLHRRSIFAMLVCEQLLVSGTAILAGIVIGSLASEYFVPLLQVVYSAEDQVPPFVVVAYAGDYAKIYIVTLFMLLVCLSILGVIISRIRIHQAIKLGEE